MTTIKHIVAASQKVFTDARAVVVGIIAGLLLLLAAIWLPNFSFIASTITASQFSLNAKLAILLSSLSAINTNFTLLSRTLTITLVILFAVNVAFLAYYLRTRIVLERSAGVSIGGIIAGLLGIGCASCGSVVLSAFLGAGATAGFLNILPLKGQEFGFLGIILMFIGIALTAKKVEQPLSCAVDEA
jgi:hypothetical protein